MSRAYRYPGNYCMAPAVFRIAIDMKFIRFYRS